MSITDKISEEKKEELESLVDMPKKKLSEEEKKRLVKEKVAEAQYYDTLGLG